MNQGLGQLVAQITLALLLLLIAGVLLTRLLRAIPGAGWVTPPLPGRSLLRRATALLLLVALVGLLLEALTGEWGRDGERRLPVFVVESKKTPAIAEHVRAALAAGQPRVLTRASGARQRANGRRRVGSGREPAGSAATSTRSPPPSKAAARPASRGCPGSSSAARVARCGPSTPSSASGSATSSW